MITSAMKNNANDNTRKTSGEKTVKGPTKAATKQKVKVINHF